MSGKNFCFRSENTRTVSPLCEKFRRYTKKEIGFSLTDTHTIGENATYWYFPVLNQSSSSDVEDHWQRLQKNLKLSWPLIDPDGRQLKRGKHLLIKMVRCNNFFVMLGWCDCDYCIILDNVSIWTQSRHQDMMAPSISNRAAQGKQSRRIRISRVRTDVSWPI